MTLWALAIGVRLVQLQVLEQAFFERQAARQSERTLNLDARRGPILDRNGRELAVSVDAESIYAVPTGRRRPGPTAADARPRSRCSTPRGGASILAQIQREPRLRLDQAQGRPVTARAVRDLQLDGIGFLTENRRYYPKRELASHVLGYVGLDNTGMSGIEYSFEDVIRGRAAKVVVRTDARRRPVGHTEKPSTEGHAVVLTIDESIQHVTERELDRAVAETGAIMGVGGRARAAHRRGPRARQSAHLQPEPVPRLHERELAQPGRHRQRTSRAASSR